MRVKKIFLIFIIAFMFFTLFLFNNTVNATMTLDQLKACYPSNSRWTDTYEGIGKNGHIMRARECAGFAALMYNQFYGMDPYSYAQMVYDVNQIQAGDIVRYKYDGHSVWVTKREGNAITIAECNYDWNCSVRWDRKTDLSEFCDGFTYIFKAPYVLTDPEPALNAPSNVKVSLTNTGINVSWSNSTSFHTGYDIKIFSENDVSKNNFSNPVNTLNITDTEKTNEKIHINDAGTYYVYVYTRRGDKVSNGSRVKFTIKPIKSIELSTTANGNFMIIGEKRTYTAKIIPEDNTAVDKNIIWKSSKPNVASVDSNGVVTALSEGYTTISASIDETAYASVDLTVSYTEIPIRGISISGRKYVHEFEQTQLSVNFIPENATGDKSIKWESFNNDIATVDSNGIVTGVSQGKTTIRATSVNGMATTWPITVEKGIKATSLILNKTNIELVSGESESIIATIGPSNCTNKTVTWSSNNPDIVEVNSYGKITAKSYGNATISAKVEDITKTCNVKVYESKFKTKYLKLQKEDSFIGALGKKYKAELENNQKIEVDIFSNNDNVIVFGGMIYGAKSGFSTIYGYDERFGDLTYYCFVNDLVCLSDYSYKFPGDLNGNIKFDSEDVTLLKNIINSKNLSEDNKKLCDINGDGNYDNEDIELFEKIVKENLIQIDPIKIKDIVPNMVCIYMGHDFYQYHIDTFIEPIVVTEDRKLVYSTSNSSIATINEFGYIKVLAPGKVTFTVKTKDGRISETLSYTFTQKDITPIEITEINLDKSSLSLNVNGTFKLVATITPTNTTQSKTITWTSSNQNVATVDSSGKITAKKAGSTTITAKTSNGKTATCKVTVTDQNSNTNTSKNSNTNTNKNKNTNTTSTNKNTTPSTTTQTPNVSYRTHVENIGWQNYVKNGATAGTSGQGLRLEGINIKLENNSISGNIEYCTHVQNIGWQNYVKNGTMSGTSGKGLRLEAIKIRLTGELAKQYDIYYRVHCQNFGWMGWAKNGAESGSAGYGYRLEAIQIKLVKKNEKAPGSTANSYKQNLITYQTHVQNVGWQELVNVGEMSGTSGQSLRLEGIKINLNNLGISGNIEYCTHVQNIGWQNYVKNGTMSGTSGKSLRLEAIKIRLTGDISKKYDVYYRVHCENFGWMGWAKNGAQSGSAGYGYRLEGIEIVLVEKGGKAPGSTANSFIQK